MNRSQAHVATPLETKKTADEVERVLKSAEVEFLLLVRAHPDA